MADGTAGLVASLQEEILAVYEDGLRLTGLAAAAGTGSADEVCADARDMLIASSSWRSLPTTLRRVLAERDAAEQGRISQAVADERRRIARELHDRMGYCLSMTQRQLELYDIRRSTDPAAAEGHWSGAWEALRDSMRHLRAVTCTLHSRPALHSLDAALRAYLQSADTADVTVTVHVNGDESWVPPRVVDESFLVLREAARNALAHATPRSLRISVDITPYELCGTVLDNGRGFDTTGPVRGSCGLASMTERADALGGRLLCTSLIEVGTRVRLTVPLTGHGVENIA
ncbi:sensor histidine kinase [Streptomyces sp. NPDC021020]|uniref:sensor histidine kinase n=1 Tax=Streptomyces sp. NPDC021020 TaxID=3365109 RepID=UPI0037934A19